MAADNGSLTAYEDCRRGVKACLKGCLDIDLSSVVHTVCMKLYELQKSVLEAYDLFIAGFREALRLLKNDDRFSKLELAALSDICPLLKSQSICEQLFATKATQDQRMFVYKLLVLFHFNVLPEENVEKDLGGGGSLEEAAKYLRLMVSMTGAFEVRQFLWHAVYNRFGRKHPRNVTQLYELLNLPIPKELRKYAASQLNGDEEELDDVVKPSVLNKAIPEFGKKEQSESGTNDNVKFASSQHRKPKSRLRRSASMFVDPTQPVLIGLDNSCHEEMTKNLTKCKKRKLDSMPLTKHASFNVEHLSPPTAKFAEELAKSLNGEMELQRSKSPEAMSPNPYKSKLMRLAPKTPVKASDGFDLSNFITGNISSAPRDLSLTPAKSTTASPQNKIVTPSKNVQPVDPCSSPEVPSPKLSNKDARRTLAPATPLFKQQLPSKMRNRPCDQAVQTILETPPDKLAQQTCSFKGRRAVAMRLFTQF